MQLEHYQPFIYQTISTFEVMVGTTPKEKNVTRKDQPGGTYDVSGIVGVAGSGNGAVVLSFPDDVARRVVGKMLGEVYDEVTQDVTDGVGELVNIITGNAKRDLIRLGFADLTVTIPNVIVGKHRTVWHSSDMPCLVTHFFITEWGPFSLEVNIRRNENI